MATTRAKFRCTSVTDYGAYKAVQLNAVCKDGTMENDTFSKYTPTGEIKMNIDNPAAAVVFKPGAEYYVDFSEATTA